MKRFYVPRETLSKEELQKVKQEGNARKKLAMKSPKLFLLATNQASHMSYDNHSEAPRLENQLVKMRGIFVSDVQHLLLYALEGDNCPYKPRWCALARWHKASHVVFLSVPGVTAQCLADNADSIPFLTDNFEMSVDVIPPTSYHRTVLKELLCIPTSSNQLHLESKRVREETAKLTLDKEPERKIRKLEKDDTSTPWVFDTVKMFSEEEIAEPDAIKHPSNHSQDAFPRTMLLLNTEQLISEEYSLPGHDDVSDFMFSKDVYEAVSEKSPMFAVDCEMVKTGQCGQELARVSLVNENLDTVYDTLVKPDNLILDYLTEYSGMTKSMLDQTTTTLSDARNYIRNILPADAILCGQSLNFDLRALKMFHPYVIDTSTILTLKPGKKTALKKLALYFLGEKIQQSSSGHCSVEDATTAMQLVRLKLRKDLLYGDSTQKAFPATSTAVLSLKSEIKCHLEFMEHHGIAESIFEHISKISRPDKQHVTAKFYEHSDNKSEYSLHKRYYKNDFIVSGRDSRIIQNACNRLLENSLTFVRLKKVSQRKDALNKLNKQLETVHNTTAENALFIVLFEGSTKPGCKENGKVFLKIKNIDAIAIKK